MYLQLERSMAANTIEAYLNDLEKLQQFANVNFPGKELQTLELKDLKKFIKKERKLENIHYSSIRGV